MVNKELYHALLKIKNPQLVIDLDLPYDSLSNKAERSIVDFDSLRNPLLSRVKSEVIEFGHKTNKVITPLDIEQNYKKQFGLILDGDITTYASILEKPVAVTQFKNEGFYKKDSPKVMDFGWMKHLDSVNIDVIDANKSDNYIQITVKGQWAPYEITLGNVDVSLISGQKLYGFLFGVNTYPKTRRYNPVQSTIAYDADLLPQEIKPYLLLTDTKNKEWVNNQYKGIEKIYLSYESIERDVLVIYVLSYKRILPVWTARVKLPRTFREKVRIRKKLYAN